MIRLFLVPAIFLLAYLPVLAEEKPAPPSNDTEISAEHRKFFEEKIRPLFAKRCQECHGAEKQSGGLRLDLKTAALELGGESGPLLEAGKPDESLLMEAVRYESYEMPPAEQLPEAEIDLLAQWVAMGAPWPADRADQLAQVVKPGITDEDRHYWAFQPIQNPKLPEVNHPAWIKQPIDAFILEKLEQESLTPSHPADRHTLLRRVYFDLIGLPPSQQEIEDFLADHSPDAYLNVVDRLLESPRFGEHMARYWLDLVRFAESDGFRQDAFRPTAWRYRDYVIDAFNSDKPYDQFLREQLAGDEIAPHDPAALTATAFLRHGVYEYNQRDVRTHWQDIINEMTDVTGDVFLGLGMGCARCHNHKFDPILQKDYFGLQAFFTPVFWEDNRPIATPEQIAAYEQQLKKWEVATADIRARIDEIEQPHLQALADSQINMFPEDIQAMMRKPIAERDPKEHQLAELAWRQVIDKQKGLKSRLKGDELKEWEDLQLELDKLASLKPKNLPEGMTARDVGPTAPATMLETRRASEEVAPQFLTVLTEQSPEILPPSAISSTGRRSALADWLCQPEHPLTARVMVNRIWQQHFGAGLVASASDFGTLGEPPSHPELLDWLATRFRETGWSMKQMHRLLVLSATYQQSSRAADNPASYRQAMLKDPANRWLWRMQPERLNADQIRDSILAATGELKHQLGGPSETPESSRRSIYTKVIRNNQHPFFTAFDAPRGTSSVSERNNTTTSTQALLMMNGPWMLQRAEKLATHLLAQSEINNLSDQVHLIEQLYWLTVRRSPTEQEAQALLSYIQLELSQQQATAPALETLLNLVQMPTRNGTAIDLVDDPQAPRPFLKAKLLDGKSAFTIEAIVYLRSLYSDASVRNIISRWNNNQQSPGWSLGITSEKSRYRPRNLILQLIGDTADGQRQYEVVPSNIHLELETPYYVAVTVAPEVTGPEGIHFYVQELSDNTPLQTAVAAHRVVKNYIDAKTPLVIGGRHTKSTQFWDGMLDGIRISQAKLNPDQLLLNSAQQPPATLAEWNFESEPGYLADASPYAHSLLLSEQAESTPLQQALTDMTHLLLNCNEFLYID